MSGQFKVVENIPELTYGYLDSAMSKFLVEDDDLVYAIAITDTPALEATGDKVAKIIRKALNKARAKGKI